MKQLFKENPAVSKICLIGHSLGGAGALYTAIQDNLVDGVIALDPATNLLHPESYAKGTDAPVLMINTGTFLDMVKEVANLEDINKKFMQAQKVSQNKMSIRISNSGHLNQVDIGFINAGLMGLTKYVHDKNLVGEVWQMNEKLILLFMENMIFKKGDKKKDVLEPYLDFVKQLGFEKEIVQEFV